jgi:uncharacterized repeat protein (TIGR01451 family)
MSKRVNRNLRLVPLYWPSWRKVLACPAAIVAAVLLWLCPSLALAAGTAAGTLIPNQAKLSYSVGGSPATAVAIAPMVVVAKLISVVVTSQDSAPVPASSPDSGKAVSFLVTNTGNATETFRLARNDTIAGDQFDPVAAPSAAIWLESGIAPGFQASGPQADVAYVAGVNDLVLPADGSRVVYIVSAIPAGIATGAFGRTSLLAASTTQGAAGSAPGTAVGTTGNGVQVVVGAGRALGSATAAYLVGGVSLGVAKSVVAVRDRAGGSRVMPGAVLTYRIVLTLTGTGMADDVAMNDPLPAAVTYVPGSLTVDGAARTDADDADGAGIDAGTVQAFFGSVRAPASRVIEFKATVN